MNGFEESMTIHRVAHIIDDSVLMHEVEPNSAV